MLAADVFGQYRVNAGLPTRASRFECRQHVWRQPNVDQYLALLWWHRWTPAFLFHAGNSILLSLCTYTIIFLDNKKPPNGAVIDPVLTGKETNCD
jgi:hypothetical protein